LGSRRVLRHYPDEAVEGIVRFAVRTDINTNSAVSPCFSPEFIAFLSIEHPSQHPVFLCFLFVRNGLGWTISGTFLTFLAKILDTQFF
jgi:hypothetical protein